MKRYGNLYPQIIEFSNIMEASQKAEKGKRFQKNVLAFNYNREIELTNLKQELATKTYQPGEYKTFYIKEPKSRMISAALKITYVKTAEALQNTEERVREIMVILERVGSKKQNN